MPLPLSSLMRLMLLPPRGSTLRLEVSAHVHTANIPKYVLHVIVSPLTADREVQRILLELLNQMDGFDQSVNVKVCMCLVIVYLCRSTEVILWIRIYMCGSPRQKLNVILLCILSASLSSTCYSTELPLKVGHTCIRYSCACMNPTCSSYL